MWKNKALDANGERGRVYFMENMSIQNEFVLKE